MSGSHVEKLIEKTRGACHYRFCLCFNFW